MGVEILSARPSRGAPIRDKFFCARNATVETPCFRFSRMVRYPRRRCCYALLMTLEEKREYMRIYRSRPGWREKRKAYMQRWYASHPGKTTAYANRWIKKQGKGWRRRHLRERFFALYGDICNSCGFTDKRALQLDHVQGDGAKHRKKSKDNAIAYREAIRKHQPTRFQTLCANCNWIKRDVDMTLRCL